MRIINYRFWLGHTKKMTYPHDWTEMFDIIKEMTSDIIPLQFIGLQDKNRKQVFEGDIISDGEFRGAIWYDEKNCRFDVKIGEDITHGLDEMSEHTLGNLMPFEVIGNIYENPKLLN